MSSCLLREKEISFGEFCDSSVTDWGADQVHTDKDFKMQLPDQKGKMKVNFYSSRIVRLEDTNVKIILAMCVGRKATAHNLITRGMVACVS